MIKIDSLDLQILKELQRTLPMSKRPYLDIARKVGSTEEEVIRRTRAYGEKGRYRRFGATLRHQKAGFKANGMGVWSVPDERERALIGETLCQRPEVSHGYERPSFEDWPYHIFTMIHGQSREEVNAIAERMSQESGIENYRVLFSTREFKKSSMRYFDLWPTQPEKKEGGEA